eukprot:GHVL01003769.1.p1 GENE.GHVL01003769.1~~GHVL01003769.1.p1  ORF type:complete len:785 (-),score=83.19 GHVL01003769.1:830-3184(-)
MTKSMRLEELLLDRILQKKVGPDTLYVQKLFKYHDLTDTGFCDFDAFCKVLEPFASGIHPEGLHEIFSRYSDEEGFLFYREFVPAFISGSKRCRGSPNTSKTYEVADILASMKAFLDDWGHRSLVRFGKMFCANNISDQRVVPIQQFVKIMERVFGGLNLSNVDVKKLANAFLSDHHYNSVAFDELILDLKTDLTNPRREAIRAAWHRIDNDKAGFVSRTTLLDHYNPNRHPSVCVSKIATPDEALQDFADLIEDVMEYRKGAKSLDTGPNVTWEDFEDIYAFTNGAMPQDDKEFVDFMNRVWDLEKEPKQASKKYHIVTGPAAGVRPYARTDLHHYPINTIPDNLNYRDPKKNVDVAQALSDCLQSLISQGVMETFNTVLALHDVDDDNDGLVDFGEFTNGVSAGKLKLRREVEEEIFNKIGITLTNPAGKSIRRIPVEQFLTMLFGTMSPQRLQLVENAFNSMDKQRTGYIPSDQLINSFCESQHPDVEAGFRKPQDVRSEFVMSMDKFCTMKTRSPFLSQDVNRDQFVSYYNIVSGITPNDDAFKLMISRVWGSDIYQDKHSSVSSRSLATRVMSNSKDVQNMCTRIREKLSKSKMLKDWIQFLRHVDDMEDVSHDGKVYRNDFRRLCKLIAAGLSSDDIEILYRELDFDKTSSVALHAFVPHVMKPMDMTYSKLVDDLWGYLTEYSENPQHNPEIFTSIFKPESHPCHLIYRVSPRDVTDDFFRAVEYISSRNAGLFNLNNFRLLMNLYYCIFSLSEFRYIVTSAFGYEPPPPQHLVPTN